MAGELVVADLVQRGVASWWAPALAFLAGMVSFASPCVFPLVPGYLSFVSGGQAREQRAIVPILLFILGFATVFTALGAFAGGAVTRFLKSELDRKSTRLNSSRTVISYAIFCLKKKREIIC